jgi:hypothetical protein
MGYLSGIFSAVAAVFNWVTGRNNANNASDVKAAKIGEEEASKVNQTNNAIEKRDTKEIENELSE